MTFPYIRPTSQGTQTTAAGTFIDPLREQIQGANIGDIWMVKISYTGNPTPNIPTGWIRRGFQANGTLLGQVVFLKYITAADLSPFTVHRFTFSASTTATLGTVIISNVPPDLDLATVDFIQSTGTSLNPTTATFPVSVPDSLIVNFVSTRTVSAVTQPAGFDELVDTGSTVAAPTTIRVQMASKQQAVEGPSGALASTIATSQAWVSGAIAIPGPDYPAFRSATTGTASTTVNATTLKPTGTRLGDLLVLAVELEATSPATFGVWPHPGFNLQGEITSGGVRLLVFTKIADLIDQNTTTAYSVSRSIGTGTMTVHALSIRNPRSSSLGAMDFKALASTATPATNAITTRLSHALLLAIFSQVGSNTATAPTGMTERTDSVGMETATQFQGTQGSSGTKQATYTGAAVSIAALLEILSPKAQESGAAWDTNSYWGPPLTSYFPAPSAEWDTNKYFGPPLTFYPLEEGVAAGGASLLTLTGVG